MNEWIKKLQAEFAKDFTVTSLRLAIILVAAFFMVLALLIDNPWVLAGLLAYIVLP